MMSTENFAKLLFLLLAFCIIWAKSQADAECRQKGGGEYEHGRFAISYCE